MTKLLMMLTLLVDCTATKETCSAGDSCPGTVNSEVNRSLHLLQLDLSMHSAGLTGSMEQAQAGAGRNRKGVVEKKAAVAKETAAAEKKAAAILDLPEGSCPAPLRLLMVSAVFDSNASAQRVNDTHQTFQAEQQRRRRLLPGECLLDTLHFALFFISRTDEQFQLLDWYADPSEPTSLVVIRHNSTEEGCKADWFALVSVELAAQYDYLWLRDDDMAVLSQRFDEDPKANSGKFEQAANASGRADFDWAVVRDTLLTLRPAVAHALVAPVRGDPSSHFAGMSYGLYHSAGETGPFLRGAAWEDAYGVEIMAPFVAAAFWPVVHARLLRMDMRSVWGMDFVLNWFGTWAKSECGGPLSVLINTPLWHIDTHSMNSNHHCQRSCLNQEGAQNCFGFADEVINLTAHALKELYPKCATEGMSRAKGWTGPDCNATDELSGVNTGECEARRLDLVRGTAAQRWTREELSSGK